MKESERMTREYSLCVAYLVFLVRHSTAMVE